MWKVEYTKRFLKDLADLPAEIQKRVEPIGFPELESENPFDLGYVEKMKGYPDKRLPKNKLFNLVGWASCPPYTSCRQYVLPPQEV